MPKNSLERAVVNKTENSEKLSVAKLKAAIQKYHFLVKYITVILENYTLMVQQGSDIYWK